MKKVSDMKRYYSDYNRIMSLIYEDQPISPQAGREFVHIPERIKSIRSLGKGVSAYRQPREVIFLHQAKMMEDYEDDFEYTRDIPAYQPTYESLTDEQLRGYFGWRTKVRKGMLEKAPQAFAFIYMYELINLVGVDSAEQGFHQLMDFTDSYGCIDPSITPYAEQWLIDFVLYYELDPELLSERKTVMYDQALEVLCKTQEEIQDEKKSLSAKDICNAILFLSGLNLKHLPAYEVEEELFERAAAAVFREMCAYYEGHRKTSFLEDYVGPMINQPVRFFVGAVFHDSQKKTHTRSLGRAETFQTTRTPWVGELLSDSSKYLVKNIKLSGITMYHFEYGKWSVKTYPRDFKNRKFADLLITLDAVLKEENDPAAELTGIQTKWIRKLIRNVVKDSRHLLEEEKARRVEIDFSSLAGIRSDALRTMEKLMTEDEMEIISETAIGEEAKESEKPVDEVEAKLTEHLGLQKEEADLLLCLLEERSLASVNLNGNIMSVLVDSINEKLFDEIGDVVIEDGNPPMLIEDYKEEISALFRT